MKTETQKRNRRRHDLIARQRDEIAQLKADRLALAKLAADTPQFSNPLVAWEAQALRDRVLAEATQ